MTGPFDWELMLRFGLGVLGLSPGEFWAMTPREFDAAVKGRLGRFADAAPMNRARLAELAAAYPDKETADGG